MIESDESPPAHGNAASSGADEVGDECGQDDSDVAPRHTTAPPRPISVEDQQATTILEVDNGDETTVTRSILHLNDSRSPTEQPVPIKPGILVDHYELIRSLGRGGMGQVMLARDVRLGRLVALKFYNPDSRSGIQRFLAEARATAQFSGHENVVTIYDIVERGNQSYMALEYVRGKNLKEWVKERIEQRQQQRSVRSGADQRSPVESHYRISPILATRIMVPVVTALARAHELGIIHRDLKPTNIMITDAGAVQVVDFGIAKRHDTASPAVDRGGADDVNPLRTSGTDVGSYGTRESAPATASGARLPGSGGHDDQARFTRPGRMIGTYRYMSPEQWGADSIDHRSDLWAVGIMLYELVVGAHPLAPLTARALRTVRDLDIPMPTMADNHPEFGKLGSIIDRCLRKRKEDRIDSAWALLTELEALLPRASRSADVGEEGNPFAGLAAFQEHDADRFFGRDRSIGEVVTRMSDQPLIAVVGPSGAGKSSFVMAGVIPALKRDGDGWEACMFRPGRHPLAALAEFLLLSTWDTRTTSTELSLQVGRTTLSQRQVDARDELCAELQAQPGLLGAQLRMRARRKLVSIVLFIDQFEELYTMAEDADREAFFACLAGVADDVSSPLRVVLAMRSDFLDRMADTDAAKVDLSRRLMLLPPMNRDGLRAALLQPITAAGYEFDDTALVEEILDTLEQTTSPLPILQFTASKLWEHRDQRRRLLTRASYQRFGGVAGTLANHADSVLSAMSTRQKVLVRAIFLRLVTPERTRAVVGMDELRQLARDEVGELQRVLDRLIDARLLAVENRDSDEMMVEIVHESLIERWPVLSQWLSDSKEDAAFISRLRRVAKEWEASRRGDGLLWRGQAAREAQVWYQRYQAESRSELGRREEDYLIALFDLSERSQRRRRRIVGTMLVLLAAVAVVLAYLAVRAEREATRAHVESERAQRESVRAHRESARAQREAASARNATRIAAAEVRKDDPTTVISLLREVEVGELLPSWFALATWALAQELSPIILTHPETVGTASFSPDGSRIASGSADKAVRIWNADGTGEPAVLHGHSDSIYSTAFSPDGTRVVSGSWDHTLRIWKTDGSAGSHVLRGHGGQVWGVDWSRDGLYIASASWDRTVRLWDAKTGAPVAVLRGHEGPVYAVAFSTDGRRVVSGSLDKTVRVWTVGSADPPIVLRGHKDRVIAVAVSPDGRYLLSGAANGSVRLWNADGMSESVELFHDKDSIYSVDFHPDGKRILWVSGNNYIRVWNIDRAGEPRVYSGHTHQVWSAMFDRGGNHIVSASNDKTIRLWRLDTPRSSRLLGRHEGNVWSVALSPDGTQVASGSYDSTVRVWNVPSNEPPQILRGHEASVFGIAFNPAGTRVASAGFDQTVRVWDIHGKRAPVIMRHHKGSVWSVDFSLAGDLLASASSDQTVQVRRADGSGDVTVLRGHEGTVWSVAFSPDGTRLVSGSNDLTVRVWNVDGSGQPVILRGHTGRIWRVSFSPDGKRVASASFDDTVRVWNADGSAEPLILRGHENDVWSAVFSPDGKHILSASADQTMRIWHADGSGLLLTLRGHRGTITGAVFSRDGTRVVSGSLDQSIRIWTDLRPVTRGDPRLWAATSYCIPIDRRKTLLGVGEDRARANYQRCVRRVEKARGGMAPVVHP
ncbi:MAG: protein kinase [Proteobacteria bacterium]|nr:protein kinase [Pseudomonadota bacterium]